MSFPNKKQIEEALKRLEKAEGTIVGPKSKSPIDIFRYQIQQNFVLYKLEQELTGKELAEVCGIDEAQVSKILRNRLDSFSTDKLVEWYTRINSNFKIELVA